MNTRVRAGVKDQQPEYPTGLLDPKLGRQTVHFNRFARRGLVVGLYLTLAVYLGLGVSNAISGLSVGPFAIVPLSLLLVVNYSIGGLGTLGGRANLDEREHAVDDHSTATAYKFLVVATILVTLYVGAASVLRVALPLPATPLQLFYVVLPIFFLVVTLPMSLVAWDLPDPDR